MTLLKDALLVTLSKSSTYFLLFFIGVQKSSIWGGLSPRTLSRMPWSPLLGLPLWAVQDTKVNGMACALLFSLTIDFPRWHHFTFMPLVADVVCVSTPTARHVLFEFGDNNRHVIWNQICLFTVFYETYRPWTPIRRSSHFITISWTPFFITFWKFPFALYKISELRTVQESKYLKRSRFQLELAHNIFFISWNVLDF